MFVLERRQLNRSMKSITAHKLIKSIATHCWG